MTTQQHKAFEAMYFAAALDGNPHLEHIDFQMVGGVYLSGVIHTAWTMFRKLQSPLYQQRSGRALRMYDDALPSDITESGRAALTAYIEADRIATEALKGATWTYRELPGETPASQPIASTQRQDYEAAYRAAFGSPNATPITMTHHNGKYVYLPMQIAWVMWQDAAKLYGTGTLTVRDAWPDHLEWLQRQHTLHKAVEFLYVVDGYQLTFTYDSEPVGDTYHGATIVDAIKAARAAKGE